MKRPGDIRTGILLLFTVMLHAQNGMFDPAFHSMHVTAYEDTIRLPHRFILPNSLRISIGELPVEPSSYRLDSLAGTLVFQVSPDSGSTLFIRYRHLPFLIPPSLRHFTMTDIARLDSLNVANAQQRFQGRSTSVSRETEFNDLALKRSGSIFRGITVGTDQGMRLQSGLRLQISGQVVPGVDVTASLTDQNTPIQPEGNTQTLQEIDKVFINITARSFRATLGDFNFDTGPSGFGSYSRKLQGIMGRAENPAGSLTLIGAASRGQFTTNHFQGAEGNQGPYQLTGIQGQKDIIVLAGTERVWIDGESMVRGEDNDYVIEYGTGQIVFTRNRLITGDSRIAVDFEYSDLKFQKSIYGAVGELRLWDERFRFRTSFLRESDDKENPLDITLTDTYRERLANAGDNADSASTSGAEVVGTGKGSYVRAESGGEVYYRYVGSNEGDTAVRFTYVGEGQGDYSFQGYGFYRYEGKGGGSYISALQLPMARAHQVMNLISEISLVEGVTLSGEFGVSDLDMNLYSAKDDGDNTDRALETELRVRRRPVQLFSRNLGVFDMTGRIRHVGDRFRPVGRMTEVEYGRKWGTEEGVFWGEDLWEMEGTYSPYRNWNLGCEFGDFKRGPFRSSRKMVYTETNPEKWAKIRIRSEWIDSENTGQGSGAWTRNKGSIEQPLGMFTLYAGYEGENRRNQNPDSTWTGFRFDEITGRFEVHRAWMTASLDEILRNQKKIQPGTRTRVLEKESEARTHKAQCTLSPGTGFSTTLMYTRRDRDYEDPASEDQRVDLAGMKMRFGPGKKWMDAQLNYQFSSTQVSELVRDTIQVQTGLGNYRLDALLGELVPDPDGDLLLRMIQTGRFTPVNDLKAGAELGFDGSRLWRRPAAWQAPMAMLRGRTLIHVERRDSERDFLNVNRKSLSPQWGRDSTLVQAMISFQQDVEIQPEAGRYSVRFRLKRNDSENNQLLNENLVRMVREKGVRIKGQPVQALGIQTEYTYLTDHKTYATRSYSDRRISAHHVQTEVSFRPRQQIELALKNQVRVARDDVPDPATKASSVFWMPRVTYALRGRGNLRAELEIGEVAAKPAGRALPYEMLGGDQPGTTVRWNMLMTYRLSGHVMATLNYRARKEPWRDKVYHTGQVEVRAFF
ncbi:hypothetical protein JW948_09490 [bacterium]|nr:hypothetical protein [bacterium]